MVLNVEHVCYIEGGIHNIPFNSLRVVVFTTYFLIP